MMGTTKDTRVLVQELAERTNTPQKVKQLQEELSRIDFNNINSIQALLMDEVLQVAYAQRNIVSHSLGEKAFSPKDIHVQTYSLHPGDTLALFSDGIHDQLTPAQIEDILANPFARSIDVVVAACSILRIAVKWLDSIKVFSTAFVIASCNCFF
jgi:serine/threonine protein phosphatase PrpC